MRAAAVFGVDAIVRVSTPFHRGRQDWVYINWGDMRAAAVFRDKTYQKRKKKKFIKMSHNARPVELTPYKFVGCYDQYESNAPSLRTFKSNVPKSFASHENCMLNDHYINV
ncbi:hypothetical protein GQ457_12G030120 [Hibiscus cannabinus]